MAAKIMANRSPCRKKIDSRDGLFCCKKGLACGYGKMNIYLKQPPFAPVLGLFAAKWSAFWC